MRAEHLRLGQSWLLLSICCGTSAGDLASLSLPLFSFCRMGQSSGWQVPFLQASSSGDGQRMTLLIEVRSLEKGLV